ncbi:MAG: hypothetical protein ABJ239_12190 [Erythrobacter sp.]
MSVRTPLFAASVALALFTVSTPVMAGDEPSPSNETDAAANADETAAPPAEQTAENTAEAKPAPVTEEKRICRRISMDMSSRRKEKVCLTKDGWRDFNQGK